MINFKTIPTSLIHWVFFNYLFILLYSIVLVFAIHWLESAMGVHVFPTLNPPSQLPPHPIILDHPSKPAPSILYHASNLDWQFISQMIIYMFQCHSPISSHLRPLPQSSKDCSMHLCLSCCLAYKIITTIFEYIYIYIYIYLDCTVMPWVS